MPLRNLKESLFPALMLSMAMGTVMALFGLFDQIVLHPLALPGQDRIVSLEMDVAYLEDGRRETESPRPVELKEAGALPWLEAGPVQAAYKPLKVEAGGVSRSVLVGCASADFFSALGIRPSEGRLFDPRDPEPGAVISWSAWQRARGALALGTRVKVDGVPLPLLGVLPRGFDGFSEGHAPEFWVPLEARARSGAREARYLQERVMGLPTYGRLRPGITPAQAQAAFTPIVAGWRERSGDPQRLPMARIRTLLDLRREAWERFLPSASLLWLASGLLVLMAALNLANLQAARWMHERQDWFTRMAIGASPARLILEMSLPMLTSLSVGALGALPLGMALGRLIARFPPPSEYPVLLEPALDGRVCLMGLAMAAVLALILLLVAGSWFLGHTRHVAARQIGGGLRWRKVLLGIQVGLSVVLLCGTLGSLQELRRARAVPLGMDLQGIEAFSFGLPTHVPDSRKEIRDLWTRICGHFQSLPGVQATCVVIPPCDCLESAPLSFRNVQGRAASGGIARVYPGAFQLLRIPLLMGRDFADSDTAEAPPVALVGEPLARDLWPGRSPLGQVLAFGSGRKAEVIGVVADHRWGGPTTHPWPMVFLTGRQSSGPVQTLLVRSPLPEPRLREWMEGEVARVDPRLAIQRAEPLSANLLRMLQPQRLMVTLFSMMGAVALLLSLLGLHVLQDYLTLQRLPEAGLRMALGATPGRVRREFLQSLAWPLGLGLSLGLMGTMAAWRILSSRIPVLPALHFSTLAWVSAGLAATGLLAALLPLARLDRIPPGSLIRGSGSGA